mgnify:CR=1 FL=1
MARPYAIEMAKLFETFEWANEADIEALRHAVRTAGLSPLRAIGSGGSLTVAHALVTFHQRHTGRMAAVSTPLEAVSEPLEPGVGTWLLSAGGTNVDVLAAVSALIQVEPRQLAVLCGGEDSPLAKLCRAHSYVDLLIFPPPSGKDGFLATNSILGFTTLLARAYAAEFGATETWKIAVADVKKAIQENSECLTAWEQATGSLWRRPTTIVLHGPSTRIGAIDLESKFIEAALGNLQIADYRNFGHGRHHWLAKHGELSSVLAFISDDDRLLAESTLALLPPHIPQARLYLPGNSTAVALLSLLAALKITGWVGAAQGIDPGSPDVPEFGRKLYKLSPPHVAASTATSWRLSSRDAAAITRKAGVSLTRLDSVRELERWRSALDSFRNRLTSTWFTGIVFDYDGTIVDTRQRFQPPSTTMAEELTRVLEAGVCVAFATGRGASVRRDLQASLPSSLWDRVLIGYYNGAEIAPLGDDEAPDGRDVPCERLTSLAKALRAQPELAHAVKQTDRPYQITLEAMQVLPESRLWDLAHQVILITGTTDVSVTRSSHSIDIVPAEISKLTVVERLHERVGDTPILTIGDRGRWPGNDFELLRGPYSLGVDEISVDPETCWNLAQSGQRGPTATLEYLRALEATAGRLRFCDGSLR